MARHAVALLGVVGLLLQPASDAMQPARPDALAVGHATLRDQARAGYDMLARGKQTSARWPAQSE